METPLSHFKFSQFQFSLKAVDCINLPVYKGSTFRGAFGHAFKKVVCINRERTCASCLLKEKCVYSYVFETPPPPDTSKMRKYPFAPHPFIITPPLEERRIYREGETLCFELTLVGRSIDYLPYFIYTFDELGGIGFGKGYGKYQLEEVKATLAERPKVKVERFEDEGERAKTIYSGKDKVLKSSYKVVGIEDLLPFDHAPNTLHLVFVTPTRLKFDGMRVCGREFSREVIARIEATVESEPSLSRRALSLRVCEWLQWRAANGKLKEVSCRKALLELHRGGLIPLPAAEESCFERSCAKLPADGLIDVPELQCTLKDLGEIRIVAVSSRYSQASQIWNGLMERFHYLGKGPLCGAQIRYLVRSSQHGWVGALAFSAAMWRLKARDKYIGWTEAARRANLHRVRV